MKFRNGWEVAAQIKEALPQKHKYLFSQIPDNFFRAPEGMFPYLNQIVNLVVPYPPVEDWHWKVISILMDKSKERLEKEFAEFDKLYEMKIKCPCEEKCFFYRNRLPPFCVNMDKLKKEVNKNT